MRKVLFYLKPYYTRMFLGFLIKVVGTFMDLGLPWVLAYIIDNVIPIGNVSVVLIWGIVMLALSIGARMSNMVANRMASRVAKDTVEKLRHDLFWRILHLSGSQVDYFTIPSLGSRMTTDTYNIHQMIAMMQKIGVRAPIILVGGIIITLTLEPVLTLVLLAILPLLTVVVYFVSKKGIPMYSKGQGAADLMIQTVRENISGIRVVKALSKTEYEKRRLDSANEEVLQNDLKAGITMAVINPMMNLLLNIGLTLVVVVGAYRVNSGATEVGKIVAFLSYFTMMLTAIMMINKIFVIMSKASASAERIAKVLEVQEDLIVHKENSYPISSKEEEFHIQFNQVSFSYHKRNVESPCVNNINFDLKKGETLGIIGSIGSGKTTLINLLMRYYDVTKGAIYLNGRDIRTIPMEELRNKFGVVFQNDTIFSGTVSESIDFSRGLSKEQVQQAAKDAQAKEFIEQLGIVGEAVKSTQFDYHIAPKGSNLSGGQKQRLLIARALAGNPEVLILDDSSSSLDYKTDSNLRKAIKDNFKDTTIIMIAQRISSILSMDHIMVLEDGEISGYGDHQELIRSCEIYREIYQSQMGSNHF